MHKYSLEFQNNDYYCLLTIVLKYSEIKRHEIGGVINIPTIVKTPKILIENNNIVKTKILNSFPLVSCQLAFKDFIAVKFLSTIK